jgi:hypothetical protein
LNCFPDTDDGVYPLHLACRYKLSVNFVLALIDTNLLAVKSIDNFGKSLFDIKSKNGLSGIIISVLKSLRGKSDFKLEIHIDIPLVLTFNGLDNSRRQKGYQWLLLNM